MPKTQLKSGRKPSKTAIRPLDLNRFGDRIKIVSASEWSADGWITLDEDFRSAVSQPKNGCRGQPTALSMSGPSKPSMRRQESSGSLKSLKSSGDRESPHKSSKSSAKHRSRFEGELSQIFETIDTNNTISRGDNTVINGTNHMVIDEEVPIVLDASSPIKSIQSQPSVDDKSSPIRSQRGEQTERKESIRQIIQKSVVNYLDESIQRLQKLNANDNKVDTSLGTKTLKVAKNMKKSRLEFSQRNSLLFRGESKPLVLKLLNVKTCLGISYLYCIVANDETNHFVADTSVVLVFNHMIIDGLDLSTQYTIHVFERWTQQVIDKQIYILNAFNVEFMENNEPMSSQNTRPPNHSIIWQNDTMK